MTQERLNFRRAMKRALRFTATRDQARLCAREIMGPVSERLAAFAALEAADKAEYQDSCVSLLYESRRI